MKKKAIILAIILVLVILICGGIWQWKKVKDGKFAEQIKQQKQQEEAMNNYHDEKYGFSVSYPKDWEVDSYDGISFFPKGFQEVNRNGISEESKKLLSKIKGDYLFNISVYKDQKKFYNSVNDWRKIDIENFEKNKSNSNQSYYTKGLSFSNDVLVFESSTVEELSKKVTRYYFFHNNDGYEITVDAIGGSSGTAQKILESIKFD